MKRKNHTVVIMPAYYAERTLEATIAGLPPVYDEIILCDDASDDNTFALAQHIKITALRHKTNRGYGGNQKTLFREALTRNPDIIIMVHPDNQYDTACLPRMIAMLEANSSLSLVIGSRMITALQNDMPWWKYASNRFLTMCQNATFRTRLSEFHSGLRAYRASTLAAMSYEHFSEGFVFDAEIIAWLVANHFGVDEVNTQCFYTDEVSSLGLGGSMKYGLLTLGTLGKYAVGKYKTISD